MRTVQSLVEVKIVQQARSNCLTLAVLAAAARRRSLPRLTAPLQMDSRNSGLSLVPVHRNASSLIRARGSGVCMTFAWNHEITLESPAAWVCS